ncbi:hypothetical protein L7F22_004090 [Adiantum nelumboides]|nr:hypothetical protein [Adiantum nelumboides]
MVSNVASYYSLWGRNSLTTHAQKQSVGGEGSLITVRGRARKSNIKWRWAQAAPCNYTAGRRIISPAAPTPRSIISSASIAGGNVSSCGERGSEELAVLEKQVQPAMDVQGLINSILNIRSKCAPATKRHPALEAALQVMREVVEFAKREVYVSYRFVSYDLTVTVLPGTLLTLVTHIKGATIAVDVARTPLWRSLPSSFVWMWLFVYVITLANQTHGSAEDARNKPTRPIPSGVVTVAGGYRRLVWTCLLFMLLGAHLRIRLLSALWVVNVLTLECWGPSCTRLHWLVKPIAMMIGIFIICVGNPSLVAPIAHHRPTLVYMSSISLAMGLFGSSIQDIRDVDGDRLKGDRLSLPILLGDMPARHLCSFLLLCSWGTLHIALMALSGPFNLATSMAILLWCLFLCYRTLAMRSPAQDHQTYLAFVYLYSFLLLSYSWVV